MSKILISFVGTGSLKKDGKTEREYRTAHYKLEDKEEETSFVALALKKIISPDKVFLIGTPHSMWEEVYRAFSGNMDDTWSEIGDWCENTNASTLATDIPHKEDIENAIGNGSKMFLIRYGINDEQIKENINIILGLRNFLNNGDEIIVDITHSFRSLPLLIMQLILYLQQIGSPKVCVSHVYYGMLDISRELGYTPIVDLSSIIKLSAWISGAYAFKLTGNSSAICNQMEKENNKSSASLLHKFSNVLSLNDMAQLQRQVQELSGLKYSSQISKLALEPTVRKFINNFKDVKPSVFQYRLAEWHFNNGNYFAACNDLVECIVTKVCEETEGYDWRDKDNRDDVRKAYRNVNPINPPTNHIFSPKSLLDIYHDINPLRNYLVHLTKGNSAISNNETKIRKIEKAIKNLKSEI